MAEHYLGIDIGGTRIKWITVDSEGSLKEKDVMATEDNAENWKDRILALIEEQHCTYGSDLVSLKVGISAPGLADDKNRMILHMPERLKGIENFDWSVASGKNVRVLNDGHAAALAEYDAYYKHEGIRHFLMLTLGTGVGGGIIIDGELYQGHGQRAGHIGHMTLNSEGEPTMTNMPGSLEYSIGNFSVAERTQGSFRSTKELVNACSKGDKTASKYWRESVYKLAAALASLNNILAPEIIVLGGGISTGASELLTNPLEKAMEEYEWRPDGAKVRIKLAKLGDYSGAYGAAIFAMKENKI